MRQKTYYTLIGFIAGLVADIFAGLVLVASIYGDIDWGVVVSMILLIAFPLIGAVIGSSIAGKKESGFVGSPVQNKKNAKFWVFVWMSPILLLLLHYLLMMLDQRMLGIAEGVYN